MSLKDAQQDLHIDIQCQIEDIKDVMDENPIDESSDLENTISKLELLRSELRKKTIVLNSKHPDVQLQDQVKQTLTVVKDYIKASKDCMAKSKLRDNHVQQDKINQQNRSLVFNVDLITREIDELVEEFSKKPTANVSNDDLIKWEKGLQNHLKKFDKVIEIYKNILQSPITDADILAKVKKIGERYDNLCIMKRTFVRSLNSEVSSREIDKDRHFNKSTLNIKLDKFSGYDSKTDFYTFKTEFEKIHLQATPTRLLPDLLKNNFLAEPALSLVKTINDIDLIWKRLKEAYGNPKTMLVKKLQQLGRLDLSKNDIKPEKSINNLSKLINVISELRKLALNHGIEEHLYYGDGLLRIYRILGDKRTTKFISTVCEENLNPRETWEKLIAHLEKEKRVQQQKLLILDQSTNERHSNNQHDRKSNHHSNLGTKGSQQRVYSAQDQLKCFICDATDHFATNGPHGSKIVQYFACLRFTQMSPSERFTELKSKNLCTQCLFPGAHQDSGKHREGKCQRDFTCKHPYHSNFVIKKHVLVCDHHKHNQENKDLLEHYKARCIMKIQQLPDFSKNICLTFHSSNIQQIDDSDRAIYMLQTIKIDSQPYTIFYDSGCSDFVVRSEATERLGNRSVQLCSQSISMFGVGGITTNSTKGIYSITLPTSNGHNAVLTGACLDQITSTFPTYPLQGKVENDIQNYWKQQGGNINQLPNLPKVVGGTVDLMFGIKYLRYFPTFVFQLPSGLTIYRSQFQNSDGSYGVIGGPHKVFTEIERMHHITRNEFISSQLDSLRNGYRINPDVRLLGYCDEQQQNDIFQANESTTDDHQHSTLSYHSNLFDQYESVGSEITYRCVNCRNCSTCKNQPPDETMSIREEVEQDLINRSVQVDVSKCTTIANLPLMYDPLVSLAPNRDVALRVYLQQTKRLQKHEDDKRDILKSEQKLQKLNFVEYVKNLPRQTQIELQRNPIKNYIPWRAVWKLSSISTPCRIVFDASMPTSSGKSLNDILAKGRNNMNKLLEIFLRWRGYRVAFHTDIQKMYNSVKLKESDWCLQRYLWQENLSTNEPPEEKIIKTLIYGVKSSGNQSERGLRETAKLYKDEYPDVNRVINEDVYVDDCMSGGQIMIKTMALTDNIVKVLSFGGFTLKGVTLSGQDPADDLSFDGTTITVAGINWHPKDDLLSFDIKELDFAKKYRGKKVKSIKEVPRILTRRICTSKTAEIFDMSGFLTPLTATLKMDLHDLVLRKLSWDDAIPDNLRNLWISHFNLISEINDITYKRAIIPQDATSLKLNTLNFADASQSIICAAIYIRFPIPSGYSCQLIFSRSKLVPENTTQPRAELMAAVMNAHTGEIVRKAFKQNHESFKFTDSQITLHWICNEQRPLKQWTRNRVIEIRRFSETKDWRYVKSSNMIADLGTRRNLSLDLIKPNSVWFKGYQWMTKPSNEIPMFSAKEISLTQSDIQALNKELSREAIKPEVNLVNYIPTQVRDRYAFSSYIIDPNKHRFSVIIRIIAIVIKFIRNLQFFTSKKQYNTRSNQSKRSKSHLILSDELLSDAERYFFRKGTLEIKHFTPRSKYINISKEKDEILYHTGRILPTDSVTIIGKATQAMIDLQATSFCVPLLDKYSPISYSIINDIHWHHKTVSHSGIETTWRHILQKVFIIEGRQLVKSIRATCERCRYLMKRSIDVSMGPISPNNLMIAPIFYSSQVDICGPFQSYSYHNKRSLIKIWLVVFCCSTTTTINIKCMEDYSSNAFLQAFTRFSCEVGYPKRLNTDEGSQLIKACDSIRFDYRDIRWRLFTESCVEFDVVPVGGHNMNGLVERKIQEIKKSIAKSVQNERLSVLQWETLGHRAANSINDLPLGVRDFDGTLDSLNIITPNRLRLGRNNDRSPIGKFEVTDNSSRIINQNQAIFDSWFELWLTSHVPGLIMQPKWYQQHVNLQKDDVVLFTKTDTAICSTYQFGIVESVEYGRDGIVRKANVRYRNANESVDRFTNRAVRSLVVIHRVDETSIMKDLYDANVANSNID